MVQIFEAYPWLEPIAAAAPWLLAGGALSGFLSGLFGIGGGAILVLTLFEIFQRLGVDPSIIMHVCVGTGLTIMIPTSLRSYASHKKRGSADPEIVRSMVVWVVFGVGIGAAIAAVSDTWVLKAVWVCVLPIMALILLLGTHRFQIGTEIPRGLFRWAYGTMIGTLSTLLSIGGGVFVSVLLSLYGRPIQTAVGTSSAFAPMIAIPGAIGFVVAGWGLSNLPPGTLGFVSVAAAAFMIPASVLAAPLGVRVAHGISKRALEITFALFLFATAARFGYSLYVG